MGSCLSITCHSALQDFQATPTCVNHVSLCPAGLLSHAHTWPLTFCHDQASRDLFLPSPRKGTGKCPPGGREGGMEDSGCHLPLQFGLFSWQPW